MSVENLGHPLLLIAGDQSPIDPKTLPVSYYFFVTLFSCRSASVIMKRSLHDYTSTSATSSDIPLFLNDCRKHDRSSILYLPFLE